MHDISAERKGGCRFLLSRSLDPFWLLSPACLSSSSPALTSAPERQGHGDGWGIKEGVKTGREAWQAAAVGVGELVILDVLLHFSPPLPC